MGETLAQGVSLYGSIGDLSQGLREKEQAVETCAVCQSMIFPDFQRYTYDSRGYVCAACDGNTYCLKGMRCPQCGAREPFLIDATTTLTMWDAGPQGALLDHNLVWGAESGCACINCDKEGIVWDFQVLDS